MGWSFEDKDFKNVSLDDCLRNFSQQEILQGDNLWYCNRCKEHKEATRHLQVYKSNKILVIAFKRFNRMKKLNTSIKFPVENFNIGPYLLCSYSPIQQIKAKLQFYTTSTEW
jgi:ubiquitin carboxyl-terminal hydrolase 4/11